MDQEIRPAGRAVTITPSDSENVPVGIRGLYVGVGGDVKVTIGGQVIIFKNLAAGIIHPIYVSRVWATETTATNLVGLL